MFPPPSRSSRLEDSSHPRLSRAVASAIRRANNSSTLSLFLSEYRRMIEGTLLAFIDLTRARDAIPRERTNRHEFSVLAHRADAAVTGLVRTVGATMTIVAYFFLVIREILRASCERTPFPAGRCTRMHGLAWESIGHSRNRYYAE